MEYLLRQNQFQETIKSSFNNYYKNELGGLMKNEYENSFGSNNLIGLSFDNATDELKARMRARKKISLCICLYVLIFVGVSVCAFTLLGLSYDYLPVVSIACLIQIAASYHLATDKSDCLSLEEREYYESIRKCDID
ncbi:TPA: hypothetical protein RQN23_002943 [Aeromonas veronii]|nr:hypothetical protein [Aeromonas veronii]